MAFDFMDKPLNPDSATPLRYQYLALAEIDLAKTVFKETFNTVQTGHANAVFVMQNASYCRQIAENLERHPEYPEIVQARFECHKWAERLERLTTGG